MEHSFIVLDIIKLFLSALCIIKLFLRLFAQRKEPKSTSPQVKIDLNNCNITFNFTDSVTKAIQETLQRKIDSVS